MRQMLRAVRQFDLEHIETLERGFPYLDGQKSANL